MIFSCKNFTKQDFDNLSQKEKNNFIIYQQSKSKKVGILAFLPLKNTAYIGFRYLKKGYSEYYNIKTHKYILADLKTLKNDIWGTRVYLHPHGITNDKYIFLFVYAIGKAGQPRSPGGECEDGLECNQEHNICVQIGAALCFENGVYSHGCAHPGEGCECGSATVLDSRRVD